MSKTLYLIGNGFDLYHGLKTSYLDYKKWLDETGIAYQKYGLSDEKYWSDFEIEIGKRVDKHIADSADVGNTSELCNIRDFLITVMRRGLCSWIESIERSITSIPGNKFNFDSEDFFISFNYTSLLENVYEIKRENILHIHGSYLQIDFKLREDIGRELSSRNNEIECNRLLELVDAFFLGYELKFGGLENGGIDLADVLESENPEVAEIVRNIVETSVKEIHFKDCLNEAKVFLNNKNIKKVVVLGSNYYGIDKIYYEKLFWKKYRNIPWEIYVYSDKDRDAYDRILKNEIETAVKKDW